MTHLHQLGEIQHVAKKTPDFYWSTLPLRNDNVGSIPQHVLE